MPLDKDALAVLITANMIKAGARGVNMVPFVKAVSAGIVLSIVGKPFTTKDIGTIPGVGKGTGVGITGIDANKMVETALKDMGTYGTNARPMMKAIMDGTKQHLTLATLSSAHPLVFVGTGKVDAGSILVITDEMTINIDTQLLLVKANGSNRKRLAHAIAKGICDEIKSKGTGTVIIVGSPTSPFPAPGVGVGAGVIS